MLQTVGVLALLAFLGLVAVPSALAVLARAARPAKPSLLSRPWRCCCAAWISHAAGLSPALGAFPFGVLLSRSPLHHQIAAEILPFKGLLLGLFFILIGMSIDLGALAAGWPWILAQVVVLVSLKAAVLLGLCRMFGLALPAALRTSLLLVQGGEFGFVLFNAARAAAIIDTGFYTTLLLVISASMALTPIVVRLGDRLAARLAAAEPVPEPAKVQPQAEALVVGYGRVGRIVMDTLRRAGVEATAVDIDPTRLAIGRRLGHRVRLRRRRRPAAARPGRLYRHARSGGGGRPARSGRGRGERRAGGLSRGARAGACPRQRPPAEARAARGERRPDRDFGAGPGPCRGRSAADLRCPRRPPARRWPAADAKIRTGQANVRRRSRFPTHRH